MDAALRMTEHHCGLGESPRWDARRGVVHWIDVCAGHLHSRDPGPDTGVTITHVGPPLGSLALDSDGEPLCALGLTWGRAQDLAAIDHQATRMRFNDCGVDSRGRLWAATMRSNDDVAGSDGALFKIAADGAERVLGDLGAGNGIAWSPTSTTMYLVDSGPGKLLRADFDEVNGLATSWDSLVDFDDGMPDGIAVDVLGGIWVALWGSGEIRRHTPQGRPSHVLSVPTDGVTALCFAGRDMMRAVITTSRLAGATDAGGALFEAGMPFPGLALKHVAWPTGAVVSVEADAPGQ